MAPGSISEMEPSGSVRMKVGMRLVFSSSSLSSTNLVIALAENQERTGGGFR